MRESMKEIERDEERPAVSYCSADESAWPLFSLNNSSSLYFTLSLALPLSPPISLYMPVTDLDTNNFPIYLGATCLLLLHSSLQ